MHMFKTSVMTILALVLYCTACYAGERAGREGSLEAEAELGIVSTTGNTDTQSLNGRFSISSEGARWRHEADLKGHYASDSSKTTAQRLVVGAKTEYKRSEVDYSFATLRYEDDRFSGYDYRVIATAGYGRRFFPSKATTLNVEGGPGYRYSREHEDGTERDVIMRGAAIFEWRLSGSATFTEEVSIEAGERGKVIESVASLNARINSNLALKTSYTVRHNTKVPQDTRKTDTVTAVTLVYTF